MCHCTPTIRTPFCGRPGCEWPHEPAQLPPLAVSRPLEAIVEDMVCALRAELEIDAQVADHRARADAFIARRCELGRAVDRCRRELHDLIDARVSTPKESAA